MTAGTSSPPVSSPAPREYGCLECRDELELELVGRSVRAPNGACALHVRSCVDCRHFEKSLRLIYRGPVAPRDPDLSQQDAEFEGILAKLPSQRRALVRERYQLPTALGVAVATAACLALWWSSGPTVQSSSPAAASELAQLVSQGDGHRDRAAAALEPNPPASSYGVAGDGLAGSLVASLWPDRDASGLWGTSVAGVDEVRELDGSLRDENERLHPEGGVSHLAQSYGRVIGGHAEIMRMDRSPVSHENLQAGTRFVVEEGPLQIALMGRLLANVMPGSVLTWTALTSERVDLELDRGLVAIRYERLEKDPLLYVHTPKATVKVTGTVFTVAVDAQGETHVAVLRGHVQVLARPGGTVIAEIDAGQRYDHAGRRFHDVGWDEVTAALPLSDELQVSTDKATQVEQRLGKRQVIGKRGGATTAGTAASQRWSDPSSARIPSSWVVPGLGDTPSERTLGALERRRDAKAEAAALALIRKHRKSYPRPGTTDTGEDLIELALSEARKARQVEIAKALERCRKLYAETATRYRAGGCLTDFIGQYGDEPSAVEGILLVGMLRMDYAQDHAVAAIYFEKFLKRAPEHPMAEVAWYRLWLASVERGLIHEAQGRGRAYLEKYPNGQFVGRVLQRFPELKDSL